MTDPRNEAEPAVREIRIMVFTLRGVRMGVDMVQIAEMISMEEARQRRLTLYPVHRTLFPEADIDYPSPAALTLRSGDPRTAVMVNMPEAIDRPILIEAVHPLPGLIEAARPRSPVWAATLAGEGEMTLLLDLYRLLARQRRHRK